MSGLFAEGEQVLLVERATAVPIELGRKP